MHTLGKVDRIEEFQFVAILQQGIAAFHADCTFGLPFVKIKNQDAAVNSKVSSFRFFLDDFSHLSV